jgi:hypothetical protein
MVQTPALPLRIHSLTALHTYFAKPATGTVMIHACLKLQEQTQ